MKQFLSLFFLLITAHSYSQLSFTKGLIVTQTDDTIYCLIPIASSFGDKVIIKKSFDGVEEKIPLNQIKYLANGFNVYENVSYQRRGKDVHKLMWLKVEGKLNLYLETIINSGSSRPQAGGRLSFFQSPTKTYAVRKADSTYLIEEENFIQTITPLILDNEDLVRKVATEIYKYEDIETLVKQYDGLPETNNVPSKMNIPVPSQLFAEKDYRKIVETECDDKVFTRVETMPSIKGGESSLADSLSVYLTNYHTNIKGKAAFVFLLTKNTQILDIEKISGKISSEKVFKEGLLFYSNLWTPALQNSRKVCAVVRLETEFSKDQIILKVVSNETK